MPKAIEQDFTFTTTLVTVPQLAETSVIATPQVKVPMATARVIIRAVFSFTHGLANSSLLVRFRRGATVAGATVGPQEGILYPSAVNDALRYEWTVAETVNRVESVQYNLTITTPPGSGDSFFENGFIEALVLNG